MSRGKKRDLNDGFSPEEEKIVAEFLAGKSIRRIAEKSRLGRTAIKNLLEAYKKVHPELLEEIDGRIYVNKNHKEKTDDDKKEKKPHSNSKSFEEFLSLSESEKKEFIFQKLNERRIKNGRVLYQDTFLDKKFDKLREYFLTDRNSELRAKNFSELTEENFWKMLYDAPNLLGYSLSDKIKPAMEMLDGNINIGYENSTRIIVGEATILASSISRTELQIQIIVDNGLLSLFLRKPQCFRTSPELIYSLVKFAEESRQDKENLFSSDERLVQKYGVTGKELNQKYDVKNDYSGFEYFEK